MTSSVTHRADGSLLHRYSAIGALDPLFKLVWVCLISAIAASMNDPVRLSAMLAVTSVHILFCSFRETKNFLSFWRLFLFIPPLLFAFHLFAGLFDSTVTDRRLAEAVSESSVYSLRILNSLFALVIFIITTDTRALIYRLSSIGIPFTFAFAIYLMLRFVDLLSFESRQIWSAIKTRFGPSMGLISFIRIAARYGVTLVVLAMRRAEQTALAMDLRGFAGSKVRTFYGRTSWPWQKWPFIALNGGILLWLAFHPNAAEIIQKALGTLSLVAFR